MVLTHHVADDARRFHVTLVRRVAALVHGVEDAPMHRLQAVARVGERARHDHAHGVIEVAALHLVDDGDRLDVAGRQRACVAWAAIVRISQRLWLASRWAGASAYLNSGIKANRGGNRPAD